MGSRRPAATDAQLPEEENMAERPMESIEPPDCFVRARRLVAEVELVRSEMGRPKDPRGSAAVSGASPREVYFQALAAHRKAGRLCREITGDAKSGIPHAPAVPEIHPGHVYGVIDVALLNLTTVKKALGMSETASEPARDAAKTPSDVFGALVGVSRQINLMLDRPFTPADVFQELSLAVSYASRLSRREPPALPALERKKRPADCYVKLSSCLQSARALVEKTDHPVIAGAPDAGDPTWIAPSDVYDLASLLVAEMAFLHGLSTDVNPPHAWEAGAPGRKLPSHVYQLAGLFEQQLKGLSG